MMGYMASAWITCLNRGLGAEHSEEPTGRTKGRDPDQGMKLKAFYSPTPKGG